MTGYVAEPADQPPAWAAADEADERERCARVDGDRRVGPSACETSARAGARSPSSRWSSAAERCARPAAGAASARLRVELGDEASRLST